MLPVRKRMPITKGPWPTPSSSVSSVLGFRPSRGVAPLVVIAKFFETLSQDQFEKCQQDWKNDWIGKVVSFAFAWYIFVQFLVAMRNATDEQNAAIYLIFPQENNRQCPWYSIHLGLCHQFDFAMLKGVGVSIFNVLDVG